MIYPCIDLMDGEVVQLVQGKEKGMEIPKSYREMAQLFAANNVLVNVIDLDAAKGNGDNLSIIEEIVKIADARVGGGIRTPEKAEQVMEMGAKKVIVGSACFDSTGLDYGFVECTKDAVGKENIIVALDVKDDMLTIKGWQESLDYDPFLVLGALQEYCNEIQCTYTDKEGMLQGTDMSLFRKLKEKTSLEVTAAGGISSLKNVESLESIGVNAVIGMAFYKGRILVDDIVNYNQLDFLKGKGTIPMIVQNTGGDVLYLASATRDSMRNSKYTGTLWRYSKTQNRLLEVGAESGKKEFPVQTFRGCYKDTLLVIVEQAMPFACHEGYKTCFFDELMSDGSFKTVQKRIVDPKTLYTRS